MQLDNAIEAKGLFDPRGKLRLGWLAMLAALIDRAKALDAVPQFGDARFRRVL